MSLEQEFNAAFTRLHPTYQEILFPDLEPLLKTLKELGGRLSPEPKNILRAFELCSPEELKVIIIGQDPYPTGADGLAFSSQSVTPSLQNMFLAIGKRNPDLTSLAHQGVLLLNVALTTMYGQSASHLELWEPYFKQVIKEISERNMDLCFIL